MHRLAGAGVDEFKLPGVQALADKTLFGELDLCWIDAGCPSEAKKKFIDML